MHTESLTSITVMILNHEIPGTATSQEPSFIQIHYPSISLGINRPNHLMPPLFNFFKKLYNFIMADFFFYSVTDIRQLQSFLEMILKLTHQ